MYKQSSEDDDATSAHKSLEMANAVEAADARTMDKFAHVAEKFVQKSVAAALVPYKQALLRFEQVQLDTVTAAACALAVHSEQLTWCLGSPRRLF